MHKAPLTRRRLLASAGIAGLGTSLFAADPSAEEPFPKDAAKALKRLQAGNIRFVDGKTRHAHQGANWRKHLIGQQMPFATILGCSDSRVPPELVFDQGFGELFVVRVAGNVMAADIVGSMAYAALHLATPLFVVMGHTACGAVTACLDAKLKEDKESESVEALLELIDPGLKNVDLKLARPALLDAAVEANVRWSVKQLAERPAVKQALGEGRILLVGAVYELDTGTVRFLGHAG
jgi:carbonic anhydrase